MVLGSKIYKGFLRGGEELRVGIIAPIKYLSDYCNTRVQYCIPGLLSDPRYSSFYAQRQRQMDLVILDYRSLELPRAPGNYIKPSFSIDIVVSPSYAFKKEKTLEAFKEFYKREIDSNSELAGCVEGSTLEEASDCVRVLEDHKISYLAVPAHMQLVFKGERPKTDLPVIFLDNRTSPYECKGGLSDILVTSLPVRLGLLGRLNSDYLPTPESLNFFTEENLYPTVIEKNIQDLLEHYEEVI